MPEGSKEFESQRKQRMVEDAEQNMRGTLETYRIEKGNANSMFGLPPVVINVLAVIGGLAILYVLADLIF